MRKNVFIEYRSVFAVGVDKMDCFFFLGSEYGKTFNLFALHEFPYNSSKIPEASSSTSLQSLETTSKFLLLKNTQTSINRKVYLFFVLIYLLTVFT